MREAAGMSVKDLAERIGTDSTAIWRIEAWKSDSRSSVLLKFVWAVKASADDVVLLMNNPAATKEDGERLAQLRTGIR
jgi:ribosome-binding protein aMBF1 (putative translation factor)